MNAYSPQWAPHVVGEWSLDEDGGDYGTATWPWSASCAMCGGRAGGRCPTGNVLTKIAEFARQHAHKESW